MKKIVLLFTIFCLLFTITTIFAQENVTNEITNYSYLVKEYVYEDFDVNIYINEDASFNVEEKQTFKFTGGPFTYVFRGVALKDLDKIADIEVLDESGQPWPENSVEIYNEGGERKVRIQFRPLSDTTFTFIVKYKVIGGLGYFKDWDELYWNVIPENRSVNINKAKATVHLPEEVNKDELKAKSYIGHLGSTEEGKYEIPDGKTIIYTAEDLTPNESFTIVAGWPKGVITRNIAWWRWGRNISTVVGIFLPLIAGLILLLTWLKWGKDPQKKAIYARYEPPKDMSPSLMGGLYDEKVQRKDINAILINLAANGYIKIKEYKKGEYEFIKLKEPEGLERYEEKFMREIFSLGKGDKAKLEDLKYKFSNVLMKIKEMIYEELVKKGYFARNPQSVRITFVVLGVILMILGFVLLFIPLRFVSMGWLGTGLMISGIITMITAGGMPKRTEKGVKVLEQILGFKDYLWTAERFRIGKIDPRQFEKFLPYAMVLGVEDQWANRFSDIYKEPPNWYVPYYAYTGMTMMPGQVASDVSFSTGTFVNNISSMSSDVRSVMSAVKGSGGSGFGGGGGGGAGGGGGGGSGGAG